MSEKSFLLILGPIWSKIVFWKKKLPNLPKNTENPWFFEFSQMKKWPELADNYSKPLALPQSLSKIFFVSQTQKFMKIFQKNHPPPQKKGLLSGGDFFGIFLWIFGFGTQKKFWKNFGVKLMFWNNYRPIPATSGHVVIWGNF